MGCASCAAKSAALSKAPTVSSASAVPVEEGTCGYTMQTMQEWRTKLICAKSKGLQSQTGCTTAQFNSALGIVISAINTGVVCKFAKYFPSIQSIIIQIVNTGEC